MSSAGVELSTNPMHWSGRGKGFAEDGSSAGKAAAESSAGRAGEATPTARPLAGPEGEDTETKLGIPVREGLQILYTIRRNKSIREMLLYVCFFLVFFGVSQLSYSVHDAYQQDEALTGKPPAPSFLSCYVASPRPIMIPIARWADLIFDEEFPGAQYKKNFYEMMTVDEFWSWARVRAGASPQQAALASCRAIADAACRAGPAAGGPVPDHALQW